MLWRIEAPHFVAGLVVEDGRVVEAAPILGWANGKEWREVRAYCKRNGWHGTPLRASTAEVDGKIAEVGRRMLQEARTGRLYERH